jgi:hypothetical protein
MCLHENVSVLIIQFWHKSGGTREQRFKKPYFEGSRIFWVITLVHNKIEQWQHTSRTCDKAYLRLAMSTATFSKNISHS